MYFVSDLYQKGKQHKLGARIQIPDKCGELVCEESLVADPSPLLKGAAKHAVSHPEELTLNFHAVHDGADCCVLPGSAMSADGSSYSNGSMVAEGDFLSLTISSIQAHRLERTIVNYPRNFFNHLLPWSAFCSIGW